MIVSENVINVLGREYITKSVKLSANDIKYYDKACEEFYSGIGKELDIRVEPYEVDENNV